MNLGWLTGQLAIDAFEPPSHTPGQGRKLIGRWKSLHAILTLISLMLFALILGFGVFTIHLFNGFNQVSDDLREVWLPSTRVLGDLNNDTSDYRAAEGDVVLAPDDAEGARHQGILAELGRAIARAQHEFESIRHPAPDRLLYDSFAKRWERYRLEAAQVATLASKADRAAAAEAYRTVSRSAYNAASNALGALTAHNVQEAHRASARTARAYQEGRLLILLALVVAGSLLAAALIFIRRRISDPLTELAATMRKLAENSVEIDIHGTGRDDEIGEMARAVMVFRANAIDLIQSQRGLAEQAAMLEQKLAYEQELTRLQRNFVAMISHEFRTPLTAIDAHAQRLVNMRERIAADDLAERAGRIRSAVQRITGLMDNLLNSSRLMDGEPKLFFHPAPFDLRKLLHEVCSFHRETAPNAYIGEEYGAGDMTLTGDRKLLFQTFSNLLSNAIKYSPNNVMVRIKAFQTAAHIVVAISDKGLGIPEQDREKLFARYYRGSNVSGIVGTGVGLYLAKTVIAMHGGDISVTSEEGQGSCFEVRLPRERREDAREEREVRSLLF
jgi:signal transduction histidine kinase